MDTLKGRNHSFRDRTGEVYGRLTILSFVGIRKTPNKRGGYHSKALWLCKCACGVEKVFLGASLNKATRSCGCLSSETTREFNRKTKTKISYCTFSAHWQSYKSGAKKRDLEFLLDKDLFYKLTTSNCVYCGSRPSQIWKSRTKGTIASYVHNGIDRVDSSLGYTSLNCVTSCSTCNYMKKELTKEEFLNHIRLIVNHNQGVPNEEV